jgi:hypothetical protein
MDKYAFQKLNHDIQLLKEVEDKVVMDNCQQWVHQLRVDKEELRDRELANNGGVIL